MIEEEEEEEEIWRSGRCDETRRENRRDGKERAGDERDKRK